MNKHEEARNSLNKLGNYLYPHVENCPDELVDLEQYINEAEATEKAYEELKQDVNRYIELTHRGKWDNELTDKEKRELAVIKGNLSKVGKE